MNEAELHVLKQRMHRGKLNKARRGELFGHAPIGYVRSPSGTCVLDPDERVQAVVRLLFDQFDREATLHGLLRYPVHHRIRIPVRAHGGPNRGALEWRRPNRATLQGLLRHPVYAGAYRYGDRPTEPRRKQPGRPTTGRLLRRPEECEVFLRGRLPAYISRDRFEANRTRLDANRNAPSAPGAMRPDRRDLPRLELPRRRDHLRRTLGGSSASDTDTTNIVLRHPKESDLVGSVIARFSGKIGTPE